MHPSDTARERKLRTILAGYGRCVVAFSGGVDSALVAAIALAELGDGAVAVTGISPSLPGRERRAAEAFADAIGIRYEALDTNELADPRYASNPANRCYFCKDELYGLLEPYARARGAVLADGLNADDLAEIRPGRKAAGERGVRSPLAAAGFSKADVRALARRLGLDVAEKPAAACLSSRFPTGVAINAALLARVEAAEDAAIAAGFDDVRVRHHGDLARLEVPAERVADAFAARGELVAGIRAAGYERVVLDLAGYRRGNAVGAAPQAGNHDLIDLTRSLQGSTR